VNPAGVKRDYAIYNDNQGRRRWDAVWGTWPPQVSTALGWTAEFSDPAFAAALRPRAADNTLGSGSGVTSSANTSVRAGRLYALAVGNLSQLGEADRAGGPALTAPAEIAP